MFDVNVIVVLSMVRASSWQRGAWRRLVKTLGVRLSMEKGEGGGYGVVEQQCVWTAGMVNIIDDHDEDEKTSHVMVRCCDVDMQEGRGTANLCVCVCFMCFLWFG